MSEVLIVGGNTAGLAAAIHARLAGLTVTLFEPRDDAIEKPCGEGLMPPAVASLAAMGIKPESLQGMPMHGVTYFQNKYRVSGMFRQGPGLGLRRSSLRAALLVRANELDVQWRYETARDVEQDSAGVMVNGLKGSWLVAADGLKSKTRQKLNLAMPSRFPPRFGMRAHYEVRPWSNMVEVYWGKNAEVYITPVGEALVNAAVLGPIGCDLVSIRAEFPDLFARLGKASDTLAGAGPFERRLLRRQVGRILFVGDAAGFLDPITGEGNHLAMASAAAAIACIAGQCPDDYDRQWLRLTRRYFQMTSLLLSLAQSRLRPAIAPFLSAFPGAFDVALSLLTKGEGP